MPYLLPLWSWDTEDVGDADRLSGLRPLPAAGLALPAASLALLCPTAPATPACDGAAPPAFGRCSASAAADDGAAPDDCPAAGRAPLRVRSVATGGLAEAGDAAALPIAEMRGAGSGCPVACSHPPSAAAVRTPASSSSDLPACSSDMTLLNSCA